MKRLVYSPRINAYIRTDSGVFDLSPFITACTVNRKINQISNATLTFRNPKKPDGLFMFTQHEYTDPEGNNSLQPMFHPMDPIIITLTRLRGKPIQVFTGYCDTTPYLQLFPGTAQIQASCSLKRLQYTYWDPGLPFVWDFLTNYGWEINQGIGGISNANIEAVQLTKTNQLTDSSIGNLLFAVLNEVGGWDESNIWIEPLPDGIAETVAQLFNEFESENKEAFKEFTDFLNQMIGTSAQGSGSGTTGSTSGGPLSGVGTGKWVRIGATVDDYTGGPVACGEKWKNGGFSYAEFGVASTNAYMGPLLGPLFGFKGQLPCGYALEVRIPGASHSEIIVKVDNGSGQPHDSHYKMDLERTVATKLGFDGRGDIEVRAVVPKKKSSGRKSNAPKPATPTENRQKGAKTG